MSGSSFSAATASQPLVPGPRSRRMASGRCTAAASTAAFPSPAQVTTYPRPCNTVVTTSRTAGSSSHTSTDGRSGRLRVPARSGFRDSGRAGRAKEKVLPRPGVLSAQMRPAC